MALLKVSPPMKKCNGFTLIEILIALVILSIAFTAIIKATSQNIKDTGYIQQKTIALWVASNIINQVRAGVLTLPNAPDKLEDEADMLGQQWPFQASLKNTPNQRIKEISVDVLSPKDNRQLQHLESYLYAQ